MDKIEKVKYILGGESYLPLLTVKESEWNVTTTSCYVQVLELEYKKSKFSIKFVVFE